MSVLIENNAVVLFQGDSITDAGQRNGDCAGMGKGYAMMASSRFNARYPEKNATFLNRGISGNRVQDLVERWDKDCIELNPSWVSILVGINDTWRRYDCGEETPVEQYEKDYREILHKIKDNLNARLIIMEPFVLPVPEDRTEWREDLDPKIQVCRKLAREYRALYVPLDGIFAAASMKRDPAFWVPDGVHPTLAGHALIAQAWLQAVKAE